jgi:hypothetical protein
MELLLHASRETFYRFMPCKRCKANSRHSVNFKNVYFNTASETEEVIYVVCCMHCKQVFKREFIEITRSATYKEFNLLVEKGVVPS